MKDRMTPWSKGKKAKLAVYHDRTKAYVIYMASRNN